MGCAIVFVILLVIGMGILCFLTGDMTAFIALAATLVIGLGLAGILYRVYRSRQRRKRGNPLSPTLRWMNAAGSILIAANRRTNFYRTARAARPKQATGFYEIVHPYYPPPLTICSISCRR